MKNVFKILKTCVLPLIALIFFYTDSPAQSGYSSSSVSANRSNGIISSDQVIVEEYMNYHRHRIPLPNQNESIAIDMRWGNSNYTESDKYAVLQVGFATGIIDDFSEIDPVNVCLVIDKSGSMSADRRMLKLKIALNEFVDKLRPKDKIAIVVYDDEAAVLFPMQEAGNKNTVKMVISGLSPDGSTNLNAGMMSGYDELEKHFNKKGTNRLILLTDGLANKGVTETENIINNSMIFNKKGIDISTIGVGKNVNFDLLRQLAKAGRGLNHFVGHPDDIEKVFIDEVESLLSPIAKNVSLEIFSDNNLVINQIYGYSPKISKHKISFELDNMNSGLTQIFLIKYVPENLKKSNKSKVSIIFKYYDIRAEKEITIRKSVDLIYTEKKAKGFLADPEVKRNYTIALIAQSLKKMAGVYELNNNNEAYKVITDCLETVKSYYPFLKDKDIQRVFSIAESYARKLRPQYSFKHYTDTIN